VADPILDIRDLCVDYVTERGPIRAIDHLDLTVENGEILGIAGESGSGKTTLAKALIRILPAPGIISSGTVMFKGRDILSMDEDALREIRWGEISMVFQSAMDALNPVISVEEQIADTLEAHGEEGGDWAHNRAGELLDLVGIPRDRLGSYSHQLSGGMRQRVGIALALALRPSIVILDEPTTALDVIVESRILERIKELQRTFGFAVIFITHDLARMLEVSDRVGVFYAARLAEVGPADQLRKAPKHPYTERLLRAFPSVRRSDRKPVSISGQPASLVNPPSGCRFHPRCQLAIDVCSKKQPDPTVIGPGHISFCYRAKDVRVGA
jgi:peptide/nickel transport system ATP-binding protein